MRRFQFTLLKAITLLPLFFLLALKGAWKSIGFWIFTLMFLIGFFSLVITYHRREIKIKASQQASREEAITDNRGYFLLLRSFTNKTSFRTVGGATLFNRVVEGFSALLTLNEAIESFGKLVTLGEEQFDAWNYYETWNAIMINSPQHTWWRNFQILAGHARLIILIPAETEGIVEEIQFLRQNSLWEKTLVFIPPIEYYSDMKYYRGTNRVFETILYERVDQWEKVCALSESLDIKLPPFEPLGCFYLPNQDFSVKVMIPLIEPGMKNHQIPEEVIHKAFHKVLALNDFQGTALKVIMKYIYEMEL